MAGKKAMSINDLIIKIQLGRIEAPNGDAKGFVEYLEKIEAASRRNAQDKECTFNKRTTIWSLAIAAFAMLIALAGFMFMLGEKM